MLAIGSLATTLVYPATAHAQSTMQVDLPASSAGQQLLAVGSLAHVNISVSDTRLWNRRVPALRGRMSVLRALRRIAAAADAKVVALGKDSFRLQPRPVRATLSRPLPRPTQHLIVPRPDTGPDIVVTASKRNVARRDFAGQLSWVSGDDLALGGAGGTDRLVNQVTNVASTYLGTGRNKLFIRGIADSSFTGPTQPTVGQYFGDLRLNYTGPDPDLRMIDLAGVEVLGGPQGTLYGAGSLGGLIRLVPQSPRLGRSEGMAILGASLTRYGAPGADVQGMLNLPLARDRLAVRIAAMAASEGGYIDRPLLGRRNVNRTQIAGGRAIARLDLGREWNVEVIGMAQRIRAADSQYADREGTGLSRASRVVEPSSADFGQVQLALSGKVGEVGIRSTTGITAQGLTERYDATIADTPARLFVLANTTRMIANETRLWRSLADGAGWLAGVSYVHNLTRSDRRFGTPDALEPTIGVVNRADEATLYGEASKRLRPDLLMTGGLRASYAELRGAAEGQREREDPDQPAELNTGGILRRTKAVLLPSASLLLDISRHTQGFVRYQQGFRPGGIAISNDHLRPFRGDRVNTVEAGFRHETTADTGFALTLAYTSWRDIQADFLDRAGLPSTANIGNGSILNLEVTGRAAVTRSLRLTATVSYNDSSIDQSSRTLPANNVGSALPPNELSAQLRQIPNVAPLTGRVGAAFERHLRQNATFKADGWIRYVGPSSLGIGPILGQSQGDYVDTALTARVSKGTLGLTLGLTNLTDTRGNRFALGTPVATGRGQLTPLRPRTLRIGLDVTF